MLPRHITTAVAISFTNVSLIVTAVVLAAFAGSGMLPTGDGALHVNLSRQIAASGSLGTETLSHYPPLYHLLGAIGYGIAGAAGVQAISFISFGLISAFTFLTVRELTGSPKSAIAAQALVTFSPVLLWYSSLTLMEPLLTAAVMASLYFVLRVRSDYTVRNALIAGASLTAVALVKQPGLPIVGAALLFLFVTGYGLKRSAFMLLMVVALAIGPYLFVHARTGAVSDPGQRPVAELEEMQNSFPGSVMYGGITDDIEPWSVELDGMVDAASLYETGTVIHEARHIYWKNLASWSSFTGVHSLYPKSFSGYENASIPFAHWFLDALLITGSATAIYAVRGNRGWLLVLMALGASYVAMSWGSDTRRLFLFVPVIATALVVMPFGFWWPRISDRFQRYIVHPQFRSIAIPVGVTAAGIFITSAVVPLELAQFRTLESYDSTQGGGFAAVGGMDSVREAGAWLNSNLTEDESFVAASVYEWEYYSERQDLWDEGLDYRTYFLGADDLDYFMKSAGTRFVVIRLNQLVDDDEWSHVELLPRSFLEKVEAAYPLVYTTSYGDIKVFDVEGQVPADE